MSDVGEAEGDESQMNEGNLCAVEAISERLGEVTALAEQLDMALRGAHQDCALAAHAALHTPLTQILEGTTAPTTSTNAATSTATTTEDWRQNSKTKNGDEATEDEYVTASECTYPQSRSSSFNTASECGHFSPWWEFDKSAELNEDISKEKMVLAVGCPDLPPPKSVLKPSPEVPPGKVVHEVTETTHLKVQHCHTLGVSSFVLTSETVRDGKPETHSKTEEMKQAVTTTETREVLVPVSVERDVDEDEFMKKLKESGEWIQLKILEVEPSLTQLGDTLPEALELQKAHNDVLTQLQNKQSPVEELLRQADHLISTQKPRAEVYAAMAESLGRAWHDVNSHLELRKVILDLNVQYHELASEFLRRGEDLEAACSGADIQIDLESVKELLTRLHELRRALLAALMPALNTGNQLLAKLKELDVEGTLDSRPERIRPSVQQAIAQVERWMDKLHVKREALEFSWQTRKTQLEQCLALAMLTRDLQDLEKTINKSRDSLANSYQLGNSLSNAEVLIHEHKKLLPEAHQLQERTIKITKATEQLLASGCFAGEQATSKAYAVLSSAADYLSDIEARETLLERAINFFKNAQAALTKLDQLEIQLKTTELAMTSPQLAQLHAQCSQAVEDTTSGPIREGYLLIKDTTRGADGIDQMVKELERRRIEVEGLCVAHREENLRISQALLTFLEKQTELYSWLVNIAEAFLQGHQDMGSDLPMAKDFLNLHKQLLSNLQIKGNEINSLLLTLPPILEYLDDTQRRDVDSKVEALHEHWLKLKNMLEARLDLAAVYVRFHTEAETVTRAMDELEHSLKTASPAERDRLFDELKEKWSSLIPLYQQAKNTGLNFITQSSNVSEPYLDKKRACLCVESVLERLAGRHLVVSRSWQHFQTELMERRELQVQWDTTITESNQTITWVSNIDAKLYPIITTIATNPRNIVTDIEHKLKTVLEEIQRAQKEIEGRIQTIENLNRKSQVSNEAAKIVKGRLNELNQKLNSIRTDYQVLCEMLISYFKNIIDLVETISKVNKQYYSGPFPDDIFEVEAAIKDHDASKQAILEMFKYAQNESEQIITRIRKQEPLRAADHDIQQLLYILEMSRKDWEGAWTTRSDKLGQHRQVRQFDTDLHHINETLIDLSRQLASVKGQYGESIASAKATSLAFVYFEKTIELLQQRIENFVKTGEKLVEDQHSHSPHISRELGLLQSRWKDFQKQVQETRRLIDLSIQYFELVDEADEWFREGSKLLVTIARKTTLVKQPEEATALLNEVEMFLKPGEERQNQRIKKISELAVELYGIEKSKQVTQVMIENREMLDSFTVISNELNTLERNLRAAEEQRDKLKREKEEADANLAAARAEAAAAEAAAAAAEEARKAAEAAAQALREAALTERTEKVEVVTIETQTMELPQEKEIVIKKVIIEETPPNAPKFIVPLADAVIQEGSRFTFECHVTGYPQPVVTWHKDGMSIQNNPDYQTTFEKGVCSLTIEETFAEDSARYTCKAVNAAGTAETAASLTVKETRPADKLVAPTFTERLEPAFAREGCSFKLQCKIEGNPLPTVQWYKNFECIDNSPEFIITYNNGEATLIFEKVYLDDSGEYSCRAVNELGVAQCTATLSVEPQSPREAPIFVSPLSNIMARAGQKIKLECKVTGSPQPVLTWTQNGKPIKESRDVKLQYEDTRATLIISEAFPKDAGTYAVTASNTAGEATSTCQVSVKGRLAPETSDSELASDMEPIKPSIQLPLQNVHVVEGGRVRLDCVIVGQPEPEVIWYHDDRPVKESSDFQLLFQGDRCSLIIQEAFPEDGGEYKVIAINSAGEASSRCTLKVDRAPAPVPSGSPPKFSKLLSDVLVSEGDPVSLECCVQGEPKPEIKWLLNNQEIQVGEHFVLSQTDDGTVKLEIQHVVPDDKGVYTVKASNPNGDAKCFGQLIVKSLRVAEPRKPHEEPKISPAFKEMFSDRTCFENQNTKFECVVTGKPTPKVKWLFNGQPVSAKNFLISSVADRQILSIDGVELNQSGRISCVAENEVGRATCEAVLSVQPLEVVRVAEPISSIQQTQHTESSFSMKREVVMQSSSSKIVTSSTDAAPKVEMHSVVSQDQRSFRQVNQEVPQVQEFHKVEEVHKVDGQPLVIEKKVQESSQTLTDRTIIHKPTRRSTAPRFITPVVGKIVDQGIDVTLEGILDGYPVPEVTWTKNGAPLEDSESVKTSFELNHAKLELKNVTTKSAGKYTCTAVNEAGSAVSSTDLVVKKTIFPPVFGRRLQAQVVKKGDRLVMEVQVSGTPDPTISWYKDDVPLEQSIKDGFRLKSQGISHTLIIEKASMSHAGKYMVIAVNSGGEARSIADVAVFEPTPETMVEVVKTVVYEDVPTQRIMTSTDEKKTVEHTKSVHAPSLVTEIPITHIPDQTPKTLASLASETVVSSRQVTARSETLVSQSSKSFSFERTSSPLPAFKPVEQPKLIEEQKVVQDIKLVEERKPMEEKKVAEKIKTVEIPVKLETEKVEKEIKIEVEQPPAEEPHIVAPGESGIETVSISKQSSLDFFVSKMKESEETPKPKLQEVQKISPEIYTKFEETSTTKKVEFDSAPPIKEVESKIEESSQFYTSSSSQEFKKFSSAQGALFEEFNLVPEPPPEIGYMPRYGTQEEKVVEIKKEVSAEVVKSPVLQKVQDKHEEKSIPVSIRPVSPKPSAEGIEMEKQWVRKQEFRSVAPPKSPVEAPPPVMKPVSPVPQRAVSPKPSTQAIEMEKQWVRKQEFKSVAAPSTIQPVSPTPYRAVSPKPSAEAIEMEKQWVPMRPITPEITESYTSVEKKSTSFKPAAPVVEPSAEGKSMEKIWAHKHSDSHLKTVWPPERTEEKVVSSQKVTQVSEKKIEKMEKIERRTEFSESRSSAFAKTQEYQHVAGPVQHYIAEATVSHKSKMSDFQTTKDVTSVIEEKQIKASDIIKSWPPAPPQKEELKAPQMVKEAAPKRDSIPVRPVSVQDIADEIYLEPGPPPEIGFAEAPRERRQSYVEIIEQDLEKNLDKEPSRVLPGSIRTIPPPREKSQSREKSLPPPLPPKKEQPIQAPPLPVKPVKKEIEVVSKPFQKFPDLEPFPFKPDEEKSKFPRPPPPPTPSKFIKGKFADSDYESDFESKKIPAKWRPCTSDTEEPTYRKVKPPKISPITRSRSTEPEPIPPTKFDQPPQSQGPPRPVVSFESTKSELRKPITPKFSSKTVKYESSTRMSKKVEYESQQKVSDIELKPGSPPIFAQTEPPKPKPGSPKSKPDSPKSKQKFYKESGYMADTDEPLMKKYSKTERIEESSRVEMKQQKIVSETRSTTMPQPPPKPVHKYEHKKHVTSSAVKKEFVAPVVSVTSQEIIRKEERDSSLESFPFKPEPPRPKRAKVPPPPSPSKFIKGETKESDYESDYDSRIPAVWRPADGQDPHYKPVRLTLTPSGRSYASTDARTPTPPTEFDKPPQVEYPPRPKFEPIEKPKQPVKLTEILKTSPKPQVVKPKPVAAKPVMDLVVQEPKQIPLKPGSPPEIAYAPGTQYYRAVAGIPLHNAVQTETSNIINFNESTEKSHRVVSVQQTTKVIKFGEQKSTKIQEMQSHPPKIQEIRTYHPKPTAPPPVVVKKFVPGEFRESDYESEVEATRIRARWTPGISDSDEPHYRKVKPPPPGRPASAPVVQQRIETPLQFDNKAPLITKTTTITKDVRDGGSTVKYTTDVKKKFESGQTSKVLTQTKSYKTQDVELKPATPPEYCYSPVSIPVTKATEMASKHMEDMTHAFKSKTQKFVQDIMTDVKTPQKPILKPISDQDSDAQAYREETRLAHYGTKHIDPDTGLIYFKYDFGYEFGVILPGQSKNGEITQPKKTVIRPPKRSGDIEMPVYHETTKPSTNSVKVPQFRPKKIVPSKNVKWEPTSESEMSEIEGEFKKRHSLPETGRNRWEQPSCSPVSLSPSLPSTSPAFNSTVGVASGSWSQEKVRGRGADTPPSTPSTPGSTQPSHHMGQYMQPSKAPIFITPLRDIAVVQGQTARFECIVQSEPAPSVLWSKNGRVINNCDDYQIQYRNGVCRLTIPRTYIGDAGSYTCTATNEAGTSNTSACLQVPGERRSSYIK